VTSRPAALIDRKDLGNLNPGDAADIVVFDEDLVPTQTFLDGELAWQAEVSMKGNAAGTKERAGRRSR
jgi:predicted amidohydrolase